MANIAELEEILDGFQAIGQDAIYPVPRFSQLLSLVVGVEADQNCIDSDNIYSTESTNLTKRRKVQENIFQSSLNRIC